MNKVLAPGFLCSTAPAPILCATPLPSADLLIQAGPRYVKALKRVRKSGPTQKSQRKSKNG